MKVEQIAEVAHSLNSAICEFYGDFSQVDFKDAEPGIQASAIDGVRSVIANPDVTPEELHDLWCDFKIKEGWTYGPEKDSLKLTHPCLVPYNQLPEHERLKDKIFRAAVLALGQNLE